MMPAGNLLLSTQKGNCLSNADLTRRHLASKIASGYITWMQPPEAAKNDLLEITFAEEDGYIPKLF